MCFFILLCFEFINNSSKMATKVFKIRIIRSIHRFEFRAMQFETNLMICYQNNTQTYCLLRELFGIL